MWVVPGMKPGKHEAGSLRERARGMRDGIDEKETILDPNAMKGTRHSTGTLLAGDCPLTLSLDVGINTGNEAFPTATVWSKMQVEYLLGALSRQAGNYVVSQLSRQIPNLKASPPKRQGIQMLHSQISFSSLASPGVSWTRSTKQLHLGFLWGLQKSLFDWQEGWQVQSSCRRWAEERAPFRCRSGPTHWQQAGWSYWPTRNPRQTRQTQIPISHPSKVSEAVRT